MQLVLIVVLLTFSPAPAVLAASPASFLESSAENKARQFLGRHADKPVQQDELAELKRENPNAYSIVNALLTKQSLGLLNPKKPTASFAPMTAVQQQALKKSSVSFLDVSAEKQARLFLGTHGDKPVQQDELAELKAENPDAYVLVKALLTKKSLGLLNPNKPTASFAPKLSRAEQQAAAQKAQEQEAAEQDPAALASMPVRQAAKVSPVQRAKPVHGDDQSQKVHKAERKVAELSTKKADLLSMWSQSSPPEHHWLTAGRPDEDDQTVQNLLGPVLQPTAGVKTGLLSMESLDDNHDQMVRTMAKLKSCKQVSPLNMESTTPPEQHNWMNWKRQDDDELLNGGTRTGLESLELPLSLPQAAATVARKQQESHLSGAESSTPETQKKVEKSKGWVPYFKKTSQAQKASTNYLASFSWDDSKQVPKVAAKTMPKVHSLMAWLGDASAAGTPSTVRSTSLKKAPAQEAVPDKAAKAVNTYMKDLGALEEDASELKKPSALKRGQAKPVS